MLEASEALRYIAFYGAVVVLFALGFIAGQQR